MQINESSFTKSVQCQFSMTDDIHSVHLHCPSHECGFFLSALFHNEWSMEIEVGFTCFNKQSNHIAAGRRIDDVAAVLQVDIGNKNETLAAVILQTCFWEEGYPACSAGPFNWS